MKRTILSFTLLLTVLAVSAQMKWNQQFQNYIDQYKDIAIKEMQRYRIPASITLAQGIFESGAGQSELCLKGNNHFGIKCHGWTGRTVYHDDDASQECFRAYNSALESYEDHSKFLSSSQRYSRLFQLKTTDYKGWARGLKACGYATNPQYADKLIQLIELYRLYEYDRGSAGKNTGKRPTVAGADEHIIRIYNKNLYLYARQGDTFRSLSRELGISARKLAKYNERDKNDVLSEGDIIYLKKKQSRADKAFKKRPHVVKAGESMYGIAQQYGIRLKSLYKKNRLEPDYQLRVGDKLRVY
ncbi:MAG: glucosaminidase domain-containing protein [Prevotella sp.]|nr:glucosaminidase domain-containing protein [Prevotella sp.]